jgi:hypothetical protein
MTEREQVQLEQKRACLARTKHRDLVQEAVQKGLVKPPGCRCQVCTFHVTKADQRFLKGLGIRAD